MYTALIAEDSKPILRNIISLLQTTDLPIQVVATAANGEEALAYIQKQPVDILLTDIRMPKMDGLTLIEQAKMINSQLKVVLISGYNDFEYTRRALSLQVFDYLLKPVERHQLLEIMERIIDQFEERKTSGTDMLRGILEPEFYAKMRLGPGFDDQPKFPFVLGQQPFTPNSGKWKLEFLQSGLSKLFAPAECWVFPTNQTKYFFLMVNASIREKYSSAMQCMNEAQQYLLNYSIHASIGGQFLQVEQGQLLDFYQRVSGQLEELQSITGPLLVDAHTRQHAGQSRVIAGNNDMKRLAGSFADMIRQRQKEHFVLKLSEQLNKWHNGSLRIAELESFIVEMTDTFRSLWSEQEPWSRLKLEEEAKRLLQAASYADFCKDLLSWSEQSFDALQAQNRKSGHELFQQIDEFLKLNIYSHVTLSDLVLRFHVSPSYISRIIKRYTQSTYVQYYMMLKMKEACRLMGEKPEMKIKDLSDVLSFSDQHYFSKVFKEYMGCSPTIYREQLMHKEV